MKGATLGPEEKRGRFLEARRRAERWSLWGKFVVFASLPLFLYAALRVSFLLIYGLFAGIGLWLAGTRTLGIRANRLRFGFWVPMGAPDSKQKVPVTIGGATISLLGSVLALWAFGKMTPSDLEVLFALALGGILLFAVFVGLMEWVGARAHSDASICYIPRGRTEVASALRASWEKSGVAYTVHERPLTSEFSLVGGQIVVSVVGSRLANESAVWRRGSARSGDAALDRVLDELAQTKGEVY